MMDLSQEQIDAIVHGVLEEVKRFITLDNIEFATVSAIIDATHVRVKFAGDSANQSDSILVSSTVGNATTNLTVGSRVVVFFNKGDSNSKVVGIKIS